MALIALATAIAATGLDDDLAPLEAAFANVGARAEVRAWDDPTVSWARFDAVLLRSTWDYTTRLPAFLDWCQRIAALTRLFNPMELVRWNTDKHYLADLSGAGAPVIPAHFLEPGADYEAFPDIGECVVKPAIGAGSRDTARYAETSRTQAIEHARNLLAQGRSVLVQPYLDAIDEHGETAMVYLDGRYSHAIRKGPILQRDTPLPEALFAAERIGPRIASDAEHGAAEKVLAALPEPAPLYARIDLLPSPQGPLLLEIELVEPSLFFATSEGAADRLARATLKRLHEAA